MTGVGPGPYFGWGGALIRGLRPLAVTLVLAAALGLSLLNPWEMSEAWGYWFFARVFAESGTFIIPDRSPLYPLYLNAFRWVDYPHSVTAEYLATLAIGVTAMVALFRRWVGLGLAIFAVVLWIPFLQVAQPRVQILALACSCWAIVARGEGADRFRFAVSYALLGLAYMFRSTYVVLVILFVALDVVGVLRRGGVRAVPGAICPRLTDWPVGVAVALSIWFAAMQSPHPWSNQWFASTTYFPSSGKSFDIIQGFNWAYIEQKYRIFEGQDFYFTNKELFKGASTTLGAIAANPRFVSEQLYRNIKSLIVIAVDLTEMSRVSSWLRRLFSGYFTLFLVGAVIYGALCLPRDRATVLFVVGSVFLVGVTVFVRPKMRYMVPFIPVLVLASAFYGTLARSGFDASVEGRSEGPIPDKRAHPLLGGVAIALCLVLFSSGVTRWLNLVGSVAGDLRLGTLAVLESRTMSMKGAFPLLEARVQGCKGVLSLEHAFVGAFMHLPLNRVYDVWEIPPFGHLGDSAYRGLRPDRIDCVLVSDDLTTGVGAATNIQIRYQNYIEPYVEQLKTLGAATYEIPRFGTAIILPKSS